MNRTPTCLHEFIRLQGRSGALVALAFILTLALPAAHAAESDDRADIAALIDGFHAAAAAADREAYLDHLSPDAVFMGTDDWERWPRPDFDDYVAERFAGGTGWTYEPEERHVAFAGDGATAWFDEIVVSPRWGRFRGTGVVRRTDGGWKIAHYSLTALVPNEHFREVSEITRRGFDARRNSAQDGG
jgi:ketosteroid isomerase-like protein